MAFLNEQSSQSLRVQEQLLQRLVEHSRKASTFYEQIPSSAGLYDFPVVDKTLLREDRNEFLARGFDSTELHRATTSGSTGTPFEVFHTPDKRRRITAEAIYFGEQAGFTFGSRLYHIKIWSARNAKSSLERVRQNVVPIDVLHFDVEAAMGLLEGIYSRTQPSSLIAYSSALRTIAQALNQIPSDKTDKWKGSRRLRSIIGQSEALDEETRRIIHERLGVVPVGRYGAEEVGIIAQQQSAVGDSVYKVNSASQIVEVLDLETDEPSAPEELGRIVVTGLFSFAQPLIRYDTGDLGIGDPSSHDGLGFRRLLHVEGRSLDQIYDSHDRPISSFVFYKFSFKYPSVSQFQLVQTGKAQYEMKLNAEEDKGLAEDIKRDLRQQLGVGANVEVSFVDEIPVLSSGKRKAVVGRYSPN